MLGSRFRLSTRVLLSSPTAPSSQRQEQRAAAGDTVTYHFADKREYIISGYAPAAGGLQIYYEKAYVGAQTTYTMTWSYPASERSRWQADNQRSADSFQPGRV